MSGEKKDSNGLTKIVNWMGLSPGFILLPSKSFTIGQARQIMADEAKVPVSEILLGVDGLSLVDKRKLLATVDAAFVQRSTGTPD
jgi:hypothetical protein